DSLCYVPTEEVVMDLIISLPPQMSRYLKDVFGPRIAPILGISAEELYNMKLKLTVAELKTTLKHYMPNIKKLTMSLEEFINQLDTMGVEKAVIFNLDEETPSGIAGLPNDYYADIVKKYPEKFIGFAGIDPLKKMNAVREISRCYDLGLRGIAVRPFMFGIPPHDTKMYPLYSKCVELDIPIWFHLSINYSTNSMEVERPIYLDIVAQDFPVLKMIAGHGGWPKIQIFISMLLLISLDILACQEPVGMHLFTMEIPSSRIKYYLVLHGSLWEQLLKSLLMVL
ncbi:MAG: amidohydrolase family protein, partial [Candidatus Lokiarchaeota archaeon]